MRYDKGLNKLYIKIPERFITDLSGCLTKNIPNFSFKYNFDYFLYIASKIISISTYKKFKNLQKVPISSTVLRFELGKHYKRYIEYLIKYNFIETDNHYIVSDEEKRGKCKCYGLCKQYKNQKLTSYELTKKSLLNKFLNWKKKKFGEVVSDEMMGQLYTMMQKVSIDIDGVKNYLDKSVKNKEFSRRKAELELLKCERINNNKDPYSLFLVKDLYGRVHTNFTNISKYIRENFLHLDGEKITQLDVISSQPAVLYAVIKRYLNKVLKEVETFHNDEYYLSPYEISTSSEDERDKYLNKDNSYHGKPIYKNDFDPVINKFGFSNYTDMLEEAVNELDRYRTMLKKGIYEFFQYRWEDFFWEDTSRDKIKKEWIRYIFGRNENKFNEKMEIIWNQEFPLLNKIIKHFKKGNYKPLSHELQRQEADIIYNKVCPEINKTGKLYFTVHDCLAVKESDADELYNKFDEILLNNDVVTGVAI